ncbi:peptide/nickel transport system substrate-binding protein [Tistlia consotensis]|uniref:Peptide/nickel transport system substrate-binding protein n=1 Tax=Tistlia consotensis USBA 355 TaxID=560819 RepID=A0A1Y6CI59_9PROT|nr:ABC transporter substrate-binding protein [Tistlia consotensis]SMF64230.1 peptide/nickel transport system substrate-binding protein [Tistlia consotensis USBA 355]SNR97677.1 peptide/nickel transport system substrate-binding protein [Tistlia consotensis]
MSKELRTYRRLPLLALSGVMLLGATALSPAPAHAGKADDTLTFALEQEVEAVNFYQSTSRDGVILSRLIWDTLIYRDPESGAYEPGLATSWKWVDATTIDFDLRQGVTFQNGEPFDADDVVFTLSYFPSPEAKVKSRESVAWIDHAEKLGQYKVRLFLKAPFPAALEFLASPLPIYPKDYYQKVGAEGMEAAPVGTGPYKVTKIVKGESITFERNPNYYKDSPKGEPQIGHIVMRTIPDKNTQLAELMTGGVDWIWKVDKDQAESLRAMPQLTVKDAETMRIGYLTFDAAGKAGPSPLTNVKVRQAIAHAINRQSIVDNLFAGGARVVDTACFPEQFGCDQTVKHYDYDPALAKKLLAEAGYPDGFEIQLNGYRNRDLAEAMVGDLAKVGIKATLNYGKYAAIRDMIRSGKSKMAFMTWGSNSIGDVSASTSVFFTGGADDTYGDAEVKAELDKGDTSTDPAVRKEAYSKALHRIADQAYWLPLWSYPYTYAYTSDLNFTPTSDEIPHFAQASWK